MSPDPPVGQGEVANQHERLCQLGKDLETQVGKQLNKAGADLQETRGIAHSLYTSTDHYFAGVYTAVIEFVERDLGTKHKELAEIRKDLCTQGYVWAMSEDKSTIQA
jgi:hypothetical protein